MPAKKRVQTEIDALTKEQLQDFVQNSPTLGANHFAKEWGKTVYMIQQMAKALNVTLGKVRADKGEAFDIFKDPEKSDQFDAEYHFRGPSYFSRRWATKLYVMEVEAKRRGLKVDWLAKSAATESFDSHFMDPEHFDRDNFVRKADIAFLLGYFLADGGVTDDTYTIRWGGNAKDEDLYTAIHNRLEVTTSFYRSTSKLGNPILYMGVNNMYMHSVLKGYGIVSRKSSLEMRIPKQVTDDLFPHFVRGVHMGDGNVAPYPPTPVGREKAWSFCNADPMFLAEIRDRMVCLWDVFPVKVKDYTHQSCPQVVWRSWEDLRKIHDQIYPPDIDRYLTGQRKMAALKRILSEKINDSENT